MLGGPEIIHVGGSGPEDREAASFTGGVEVVLACASADPVSIRTSVSHARDMSDAPIVVLVDHETPGVMREALVDGVFDVVTTAHGAKYVAGVLERARLFGAGEPDHIDGTGPEGHVVTLFSTKGGVGRTALAGNIGAALARDRDHRVLLLDAALDGGDVAIDLGMSPERDITDLARGADIDLAKVNRVVAHHAGSGVDVLAAPMNPGRAGLLTPLMLVDVIDSVRSAWDVVVIDTPARLDEHTLAVVDRTADLLLVVTPDIAALRRSLFGLAELDRLGFPRERVHLVLNMDGREHGLSHRDVAKVMGEPIELVVPFDSNVLAAENHGVPVVAGAPDSPAAAAVSEICNAIEPSFQVDDRPRHSRWHLPLRRPRRGVA